MLSQELKVPFKGHACIFCAISSPVGLICLRLCAHHLLQLDLNAAVHLSHLEQDLPCGRHKAAVTPRFGRRRHAGGRGGRRREGRKREEEEEEEDDEGEDEDVEGEARRRGKPGGGGRGAGQMRHGDKESTVTRNTKWAVRVRALPTCCFF